MIVFSSGGTENKGILLKTVGSNKEFSVIGLNQQPYSTDAYMAIPTDVLGQEYRSVGWGVTIGFKAPLKQIFRAHHRK
jgi:hypothetical protein